MIEEWYICIVSNVRFARLCFFKDFHVFEIRKNVDLRKILVTPKIFLKSTVHCAIFVEKKFSNLLTFREGQFCSDWNYSPVRVIYSNELIYIWDLCCNLIRLWLHKFMMKKHGDMKSVQETWESFISSDCFLLMWKWLWVQKL